MAPTAQYVRLAANSKAPLPGRPRQITTDLAEVRRWIAAGENVGVDLQKSGRIVADFDGIRHCGGVPPARHFFETFRRLRGEPPRNVVRTPSGVHFHFAGETNTRAILDEHGQKIGDLKASGHVVIPPSVVNDQTYLWLAHGTLQRFPVELFPATRPTFARKVISDIRSYLARVESIQGEHGSSGLVRAAACCRDAGLSEAEAMAELIVWNSGPTVEPSWSLKELARAVTNVYVKGKGG